MGAKKYVLGAVLSYLFSITATFAYLIYLDIPIGRAAIVMAIIILFLMVFGVYCITRLSTLAELEKEWKALEMSWKKRSKEINDTTTLPKVRKQQISNKVEKRPKLDNS